MKRMLAGLTKPPAGEEVDLMSLSANDGRGFVERMRAVDELTTWLSKEELDHSTAEFSRTGLTRGINWYRKLDTNWATTPQLHGVHATVHSAFPTRGNDTANLLSPHALDRKRVRKG